MLIAHLSTPPPPLATRRPDIPPALAATVHRALEKLPGGSLRLGRATSATPSSGCAPSVATRRAWWPTAALVVAVAALFWWSPWRPRASQTGPGERDGGAADRIPRPERHDAGGGAALDDALRLELQAVPGLRVIDVGDQPELPVDTLRQRYRADWIIRGSLDRIGDSVGATVRLLDAASGTEVRSGCCDRLPRRRCRRPRRHWGRRACSAASATALDSVLLESWRLSLGTDSATSGPAPSRAGDSGSKH